MPKNKSSKKSINTCETNETGIVPAVQAATPEPNAAPISNPVTSIALKAALKARGKNPVLPIISSDDALSRARFLSGELLTDLQEKLNIELISKEDASKIVQPLLDLVS